MSRKLILVIDDKFKDVFVLKREFSNHEVHWARTLFMAEDLMRMHEFDLIVCDYFGTDTFNQFEPDLSFLPQDKTIVCSSVVPNKEIDFYFTLKNDLISVVKAKGF